MTEPPKRHSSGRLQAVGAQSQEVAALERSVAAITSHGPECSDRVSGLLLKYGIEQYQRGIDRGKADAWSLVRVYGQGLAAAYHAVCWTDGGPGAEAAPDFVPPTVDQVLAAFRATGGQIGRHDAVVLLGVFRLRVADG